MSIVLKFPTAYSHCLYCTVTVSDMKSRSAHAFMCVMVVGAGGGGVCVGGGGGEGVSGCFLMQSPEMKLAFLLQFISR